MKSFILALSMMAVVAVLGSPAVFAQGAPAPGSIEGVVTLPTNNPAHRATVRIVQLGSITETDDDGRYRFEAVPAGSYDIVASQTSMTSSTQRVELAAGASVTANLRLNISPLRTQITVTATGVEQVAFQSIPTTTTLDAFDLSESMATSLGEVLDGKLGIAKRSFGTGNARPVIRGFDGDRVLVMQDGVSVGSLASQSGDHAEPIDASNLERIEVVKGPATLLYGSNAVGGVINAISSHQEFHGRPHQGLLGQLTSSAGSGNGQAGASFSAQYGAGPWTLWLGGGGQRTGDYATPIGTIENSRSRILNGSAGFGWFGSRAFASLDYKGNEGRYGVPFANLLHAPGHQEGDENEVEAVNLAFRRHNARFTGGFHDLGTLIDGFELNLNYSDWNHDEVETLPPDIQQVATTFENQMFSYRGVFTQGQRGPLRGSFGFQGAVRNYEVTGEEALSPPVDQNMFAAFALEELNFERVQLQLGGRLETNRYSPIGVVERVPHHHDQAPGAGEQVPETVDLPDQTFTGFSGGIGARFDLWQGGAFVANYTHSFRAPALEELYNFGPHIGNLTFEIGNPGLRRERSNGYDFSLRQEHERVRGEANFFYYDFSDFVYLAPTGEVAEGLTEAEYQQADARFLGAELKLDVGVHPNLWLNLAMDAVSAELTDTGESLPRIPPVRGKIGLDFRYAGLSVKPHVVMANSRREVFQTETTTAGYALLNLEASYTIPQQHFSHHFSVDFFNMAGRLYRNHVSFIKDLAPEIGRGVRFGYSVKFF